MTSNTNNHAQQEAAKTKAMSDAKASHEHMHKDQIKADNSKFCQHQHDVACEHCKEPLERDDCGI